VSLQLHELTGCAPAPLANYLKALGVLRLVVEQEADPEARGWWQDERFRLLTKLTREELEQFFLHRYAPTPLLSPWNKGCGFFKPGDPGLAPLEQSRAERFGPFRSGITESRRLLDEQSAADQVIRAIKARTKTNKTFQTDDQRELLEDSDMFRACVSELRTQKGLRGPIYLPREETK
jgi:CRISPR-associated protein Csx17